MNQSKMKYGFMAALCVLLVAIIGISAYTVIRGPRGNATNSGATLVTDGGNTYVIRDTNSGEMTIPKYNIPINTYDIDNFTEKDGIISYNGTSELGINVNSNNGEIDWAKVKDSGVDFAIIRLGYRGKTNGSMTIDSSFETNIEGALGAGLKVGVYYFSRAATDAEADEEAAVVLEKIKGYQISYPVIFYWDFVTIANGDTEIRTKDCTPTEISGFAEAFCSKVKKAGHNAAFYVDKDAGYNTFNMERLADYDVWYCEYAKIPAFYYNFQMWQYSSQGTVPGIGGEVSMSIALKKY